MYAYVTLVMLGDRYVPGALVLAKSLLCNGTRHRLVCMVTPDVSAQAVARLAEYYRVVVVDYVRHPCPRMLTKRQNQLYGGWIDSSFTKWQCLALTEYDKIVYMDADHLVVKNVDHLFELNAPALCFHSDYHSYYSEIAHGDRLPPERVASFLRHNSVLAKTGTALFKPSRALHSTVMRLIGEHNLRLTRPNRHHNGFDEQVLLQALVKSGATVTQLSPMYAWSAGAYFCLRKHAEPYVINYYGDRKPWTCGGGNGGDDRVEYMDVYIWRYFAALVQLDASRR